MHTMRWIKVCGRSGRAVPVILSLLIALAGCATQRHAQLQVGPSMRAIYHSAPAMAGMAAAGSEADKPLGVSDGQLAGYTRTAANELDQLFPALRNPPLYIYVYPHLTRAGLPVPGYTTTITLYPNAVNYALPGEAITPQDGAPSHLGATP